MRGKLFILILRLLALLPLRLAHALGFVGGWLIYAIPNKSRDVAKINIEICFPDKSAEERERILKQSLIESAKTFTEIGGMWCWSPKRIAGLCQEVVGEEHLLKAKEQGNGMVMLTPHVGQWEYLGLYYPSYMPLSAMYRPMRLENIEDFITNARQRAGASLEPANTKGVKAVFAALKRKEMVGILPDQNPVAGAGEYAPFFDRPAYTMVLVSKIAIKTGVPVLISYAERLPKGRGFRIVIHPVDEAIAEKPLEQSVTVLNRAIADCIREIPNQYQWIYKRFKFQPDGMKNPY